MGKNIKLLIILVLTFMISMEVSYSDEQTGKQNTSINGLTKGEQEHFSVVLGQAFREGRLHSDANKIYESGDVEGAIKRYKVLKNEIKDPIEKLLVRKDLVVAYEKNRDYKQAQEEFQAILTEEGDRGGYRGKEAEIERLEYLKYASQGEYDKAASHAEKAYEASKEIPFGKKEGKFRDYIVNGYLNRLNDLIAAKEYIISLKGKKEEK